jgi:DNA-binding response OmpR family regulator
MATRPCVLVVDDEPGPRESLKIVLKPEFEVVPTDRGSHALSLLRERSFDMVLLDLTMPDDLSGTETLRAIRDEGIDVDAIVITGQGALDTAVTCLRLGARDYIEKPFKAEYVVSRVRSAIADRNARLRAMRTRDDILNNMSHELRTPIAAIFGYREMLSEAVGARLNPEEQSYLSAIQENSERLLSYIEGTLFLTELDAGTFRIEPRAFGVRPWLERLLTPVRRVALRRGAVIHLECDESLIGYSHPETLAHLLAVPLRCAASGGADEIRVRVRPAPEGGLSFAIDQECADSNQRERPPVLSEADPVDLKVVSRAAAALDATIETRTRLAPRRGSGLLIELPAASRMSSVAAHALEAGSLG